MSARPESILHHECHGAPHLPPVVFLHGFMGNGKDWDLVVGLLSRQYRCITIDLPGHGRSLTVPDSAYSFSGVARAVIQVMEKIGIPTAPLAGYSMGGRIALYLAAHYPANCSALIIESATAGLVDEKSRAQRKQQDDTWARRMREGTFEDFLRTWYSQPVFASLARSSRALEAMVERRQDNDTKCLARALRAFSVGMQEPLWEQLPSLHQPVLLVTGRHDDKYVKILQRMARRLPRATVTIDADAGHNVHVENPVAFVEAIKTFIGCLK